MTLAFALLLLAALLGLIALVQSDGKNLTAWGLLALCVVLYLR